MSAILRVALTAALVSSLAATTRATTLSDASGGSVPVVDPSLPYPEPVRSALARMIKLDKARGLGEPERTPTAADGVVPASLVGPVGDGSCSKALDCGAGCDCGAECVCGDACCACLPTWTVTTGAVILNRATPDPSRSMSSVSATNILSSGSDFDFDWAAGPEISIARRMASGNVWEVRYFGALNWNSTVNYGSPVNFQVGPFQNVGPLNLSASYQTSLDSAELNWRHPLTERFTWLAGVRWIELGEVLDYRATFPPIVTGDIYVNSNNHLYGAQTGGEFNLWRGTSPWSLRAVGKAGIYGNSADNDFSLIVTPGGRIDAGASRGQAAFVGEIGVIGGYQLTQHVTLRGGYQLLWIDGVAIASDQAAAATAALSANVIDTHGDVFFHGATCGLEFAW